MKKNTKSKILTTFAVYEMKSVYRPDEPIVHLGYAVVYNPTWKYGALRTGYVKIDLATLRRDYNLNRYSSVAELDSEIQRGMGHEVVEAFAGRYIDGWYHKDDRRLSGDCGCLDFCRYYYDIPHTIVYIQAIRRDRGTYTYRVFSARGVGEEELIELHQVKRLCMCKYVKEDSGHTLRLRFYDVGTAEIAPAEVVSYTFDDGSFERLLADVDEVNGVVYSAGLAGEHEGMLSGDAAQLLLDYCEFNLSGGIAGGESEKI